MNSLNAWLQVTLFGFIITNFVASTPSLLSQVKAQRRQQFQTQAESLHMPNWASAANPYYMQQQQWNPRANPYSSYGPMQSQAPYGQMSSQQIDTKYKTKALKLVQPQVRQYLNDRGNMKSHSNPLLMQKKMQHQMEKSESQVRPLRAQRQPNRGLKLRKEIIDAMSNNALNNTFNSGSLKSQNKTTPNIHRFRPGKWTNIFSAGSRRRNSKSIDSDEEKTNDTIIELKADNDATQIDLIKQNSNTTVVPTIITNGTSRVRFVPGARRRYGYKNFKQIQSNSTDDANNGTQLRAENEFYYRKNLRYNNNTFQEESDDQQQSNEIKRRPFGKIYEKKMFISYIRKKKLMQLLKNETDNQPNDLDLFELTTIDTPISQTTLTSLTNLFSN